MKLRIDNPAPGQWAFGIVSWQVVRHDPSFGREVFIAFWRWALCLTIGSTE